MDAPTSANPVHREADCPLGGNMHMVRPERVKQFLKPATLEKCEPDFGIRGAGYCPAALGRHHQNLMAHIAEGIPRISQGIDDAVYLRGPGVRGNDDAHGEGLSARSMNVP